MITVDAPARPPSGRAAGPRTEAHRKPPGRRLIILVLLLAMLFPAASYGRALAAPGGGGWQVQSVEWMRDHGGAPAVNKIENWWYARQAPPTGAPASGSVPRAPAAAASPTVGVPAPIAPPASGSAPLPGEGRWVPGRVDAHGTPAIYTTYERPDPAHPSVVAGVAWMRADDTSAHLVPGLQQPGGSGWTGGGHLPSADVPALVATFNSGWKSKDIDGGFYLDGHTGHPLRNGEASVVIDDRGRVRIGEWGRDLTMDRHVRAVRQNLGLVIDQGRPVPGLADNGHGRWGSARNQLQFTWRSGLGTDSGGDLIYVAGSGLTLRTLAAAMVQAGVQRGMELDIHTHMVAFSSWRPGPTARTATPTRLLPNLPVRADRYLSADQRDFFYVTLR